MNDGESEQQPAVDAAPAITSRGDFQDALRWGFRAAIQRGARRIVCSDAGFTDWAALDDPTLLTAVADWLKQPQRRLVLLARSYDEVPRRWPRFTAWRRNWQHAVDAWQAPQELATGLPTLLVADKAVSVHLTDPVHWRGRAALDERLAHQWRELVDAVLQRSEPGFAASTLGL